MRQLPGNANRYDVVLRGGEIVWLTNGALVVPTSYKRFPVENEGRDVAALDAGPVPVTLKVDKRGSGPNDPAAPASHAGAGPRLQSIDLTA